MNQGGANQPPSFKTNVNRMKTQRWVEAKSYSYDGDDWGDADDYDEYGTYDEPPPAQKPTGLRQAGQAAGRPGAPYGPSSIDTSRAVSQPPQAPYQQSPRERSGSFSRGDDRRAFSGPGPVDTASPPPRRTAYGQSGASQQMGSPTQARQQPPMHQQQAPPPQPFYQQPGQSRSRPSLENQGRPPSFDNRQMPPAGRPRQPSDSNRAQSMTSNSSDYGNRRDFSPSAMPQPLHSASRPPRKSSLSQSDTPPAQPIINTSVPDQTEAAPRSSTDAPTPTLIRPADIYRRMQEEKEKERLSQDSARPPMDHILGARDQSPGQGGDGSTARLRSPALDTVAERKSEYGLDGMLGAEDKDGPIPPARGASTSPILPEISGFGGGFGDDFGTSFMNKRNSNVPTSSASAAPPAAAPATKEKEVQREPSMGFTSAVHTAFDHPAVPETPSSENGSGIGRSNSESTSVISPIISRGPSSAYADPKAREEREAHIPAIAEEPASRHRSIDMTDVPEDAISPPGFIPGHRRNVSTPSPDNSPARTPALEVQNTLRNPQEVEIADTTPTPTTTAHTNSTASNASRQDFFTSQGNSENTPKQSPQVTGTGPTPSERADSPSKGRVRDLADKFDSNPNSSRGSQDSLRGSTSGSPTREPERPVNERLESFRPNLPGGWNSYTTNAPSGASQQGTPQPVEESKPIASTLKDASHGTNNPVTAASAAGGAHDPFAAAQAAGAALAGALVAATGVSSPEDAKSPQSDTTHDYATKPARGALHPQGSAQRTLMADDSSSSIVPTPIGMGDGHDLTKDKEYFPQPLSSRSREQIGASQPPRVSTPPQRVPSNMSTEPSPSDQESDKLRKQLVRELSPHSEEFGEEPHRLQPSMTNESNLTTDSDKKARHDSSLVPSEYDRYWNSSNAPGSRQQTMDSWEAEDSPEARERNDPIISALPVHPSANAPPRPLVDYVQSPVDEPSLTRKFSWEMSGEDLNQPKPQESLAKEPPQLPQPPTAAQQVLEPVPIEQDVSDAQAPETTTESKDFTERPFSDAHASVAETLVTSEGQSEVAPPTVAKDLPQEPVPQTATGTEHEPPKPVQLSVPAKADSDLKALSFKEIMALKTAEERTQMFNDTRAKYAGHQTGLNQWLASTLNNRQEHMDLVKMNGSLGSSPRPMAKVNTGGHGLPHSSTQSQAAPTPMGHTPSFSIGAGSSAGRVSSHQMQTKGKDLLKGAGVLSGKGAVAAKGLFAKGKKRFGGGDKASSRTPSASASVPIITPDTTPSKSFGHRARAPSIPIVTPLDFSRPRKNSIPIVTPLDRAMNQQPSTVVPQFEYPVATRAEDAYTPRNPSNSASVDSKDKIPPKTPPTQYKLFPTQSPYGRTSPAASYRSNPSAEHRQSPSQSSLNARRTRDRSASNRSNMSIGRPSVDADQGRAPSIPTKDLSEDKGVIQQSQTQERTLPTQARDAQGQESPSSFPKPPISSEAPQLKTGLEDSPTIGDVHAGLSQPDVFTHDSGEDNTPTQAHFPPFAPHASDPRHDPTASPPAAVFRGFSETPDASPNASKRSSTALGAMEARRIGAHIPEPPLPQLPKPTVDSPRNGPSLATGAPVLADIPDRQLKLNSPGLSDGSEGKMKSGSPVAANVPGSKSKTNSPITANIPESKSKMSSPAVAENPVYKLKSGPSSPTEQRPFSFIQFGSMGTPDLSLENPITPESEKVMALGSRISEDSDEYDHEGRQLRDSTLSQDKGLEAGTLGEDPYARPRSSPRVFEEPDIHNHPAFRRRESEQSQSQSQSHPKPPQSRSSVQFNQPGPSTQQRPSNSSYPSQSSGDRLNSGSGDSHPVRTSSRPPLTSSLSQSTTHSSISGKKKKRASFFSTLSGQSDKSKRHSEVLDYTVSAESQPPLSPYKPMQQQQTPPAQQLPPSQLGIQQLSPPNQTPDPQSAQSKQKGHKRFMSSAKLLNFGGARNNQVEAPITQVDKETPEKGKKKRLSGLTGFFSKPLQKRGFSNSAYPPNSQAEQKQYVEQPIADYIVPPSQQAHRPQPNYQAREQQPHQQSHPHHLRQVSEQSYHSYNSNQRQGSFSQPPPQPPIHNYPFLQNDYQQDPSYANRPVSTYPHQPQNTPHGPPPSDYIDNEPLDGYYSPERDPVNFAPVSSPTEIPPDQVPFSQQQHQHQYPSDSTHSRHMSEPLTHIPQASTSSAHYPVHRPQASQPIIQPQPQKPQPHWERHPAGPRQQPPPQSDSPPPPPPPPKDPPKKTPSSSKRTTVRSSYAGPGSDTPSSRVHTQTRTQTSVSISSTPSVSAEQRQQQRRSQSQSQPPSQPQPPPQSRKDTQSPHQRAHERAHSSAHEQALRQSLPLLQTTHSPGPSHKSKDKGREKDRDSDRRRKRTSTPATAVATPPRNSAITSSSAPAGPTSSTPGAEQRTPEDVRRERRLQIESGGATSASGSAVASPAAAASHETEHGRGGDTFKQSLGVGVVSEGEVEGFRKSADGGRNAGGKVRGNNEEDEEEVVVMSSTAYPGQEWRPDLMWDGT